MLMWQEFDVTSFRDLKLCKQSKHHTDSGDENSNKLNTMEEGHGNLTFGRMFSLLHFHFQFKSLNISTILTSERKMFVCLET